MGVSKKRRRQKNKNRRENRKMTKEKKAAFMNKNVNEAKEESNHSVERYNYYPEKTISKVPVLDIEKEERIKAICLMRSIFEVQSESGNQYEMINFVIQWIKDLKDDTITFDLDASNNIYITKGRADTYPCIVAHLDTVHRVISDEDYRVLNSDKEFFAVNMRTHKSTGIGGDDNNGIYCALDNLVREDKIKLAFFVDEEIGCQGSAAANMDFFNDVSFVFQADRQGYEDVANDIMYTEMFDIDFLTIINETLEKYGRELVDGGMTDVMQLAHNGLGVAMANFSCGYYRPHTDSEYVVIDELILTSILFRDLIKVAYIDGERHEMERVDTGGYGYYGGWDYHDYGKSTKKETKVKQLGTATESYSELESDDDGMNNTKRIHSGSVDVHTHDADCSYCGQPTLYDQTMDMGFCNNCMDYDYNSANRTSPTN